MTDNRFSSQTGGDTAGRSPEYTDQQSANRASQTGDYDAEYQQNQFGATDRQVGDSDRTFGDNTDGLGRDQTDRVTADESNTLISADKVQGTAVYQADGERVGTVDSIMLNKRSGKVAYAVMSFGGFLGIGEKYHPLPWDSLTYDTDKGGYNIGYSAEQLRGGPSYSRDELGDDNFGSRGREIDDYYGSGNRGTTTSSGMGSIGGGSNSDTAGGTQFGGAGTTGGSLGGSGATGHSGFGSASTTSNY